MNLINFENFKSNSIRLFNLIALFNLLNLLLFNYFDLSVFLLFLLIYVFTLLMMTNIRLNFDFIIIKKNYFVFFVFLFFSSIFTIFYSKYGYIINTLEYGLHYSRSATVTSSGMHSVISVFFYPLSLLVVFFKKNRFTLINFLIIYITLFIDFYFSGARNAPFFVLIFHALFIINLKRKIFYLYGVVSIIFIIFLFSFSTFDRSGTDLFINDYFYQKIILSKVNINSNINEDIIFLIYQNCPIFLPAIYFINYMGHGIFEFINFIYIANFDLLFPKFIYLYDEFSLLLKYNSGLENKLYELNFNFGNYHTIYSSLIIDFGILLPFILIVFILIKYQPFKFIVLAILSLGFIENYFYNGIGLVRYLVFFIIYYIFKRINFKLR